MNSSEQSNSFTRRRAPRFEKPLDFSQVFKSGSIADDESNDSSNGCGYRNYDRYCSNAWREQLSAPVFPVNQSMYSSSSRVSSTWSPPITSPWSRWSTAENYTTSPPNPSMYKEADPGTSGIGSETLSPRGTGFWSKDRFFDFDLNTAASTSNADYSPRNCPSSPYRPPRIRRRMPSCVECVFCKNNKEKEEVYKNHILKDPQGIIMCPKLRAYNCPVCNNGGGPFAHTIRYCPQNRPNGWRNKGTRAADFI